MDRTAALALALAVAAPLQMFGFNALEPELMSCIVVKGKAADWAPEVRLDAPVVLLEQSKSASIVNLRLPIETESAEIHPWL